MKDFRTGNKSIIDFIYDEINNFIHDALIVEPNVVNQVVVNLVIHDPSSSFSINHVLIFVVQHRFSFIPSVTLFTSLVFPDFPMFPPPFPFIYLPRPHLLTAHRQHVHCFVFQDKRSSPFVRQNVFSQGKTVMHEQRIQFC